MQRVDTPEAVAAWVSGLPSLDVQPKGPASRLYVGPLTNSRQADFVLEAAKTCRTLKISQPELELTALVSLSRCIADYRKAIIERDAAQSAWQRAAAHLDHQDPAHEDFRIRYVAANQALVGADAALAIAERTLAIARGELVS